MPLNAAAGLVHDVPGPRSAKATYQPVRPSMTLASELPVSVTAPVRQGASATTAPRKPIRSPATRAGPMVRSVPVTRAMASVNSGVVALRIEASPLAMCVCPQPNSAKGTTLLSKASRRIEPQISRGR